MQDVNTTQAISKNTSPRNGSFLLHPTTERITGEMERYTLKNDSR